ncbi:MAG: DUF3810 family protein [Planctomycetota bacterium]
MCRIADHLQRSLAALLILAALAVAAWLLIAPPDPAAVESVFVRGVYPRLLAVTVPLTQWTSWSLTEVLLAGLLVVGLRSVLLALVRWRRHTWSLARAIAHAGGTAATVSALLYLAFIGSWGLLYLREPLERRLAWPTAPASDREVLELERELAQQAQAACTSIDHAVARALEATIAGAVEAVTADLDRRRVLLPRRVKAVWPARLLAITGTTGITSPWLHEAQIDPALLPLEAPFVMAHELAHVAGYASEAEANLIGYLACWRTGAPAAQYSALLALLPSAVASVPDDLKATAVRELDPRVRDDLHRIAARARQDQSALLAAASRTLYDAYLKQQGVPEGVHDYARVITLLLGYRRASRSRP